MEAKQSSQINLKEFEQMARREAQFLKTEQYRLDPYDEYMDYQAFLKEEVIE